MSNYRSRGAGTTNFFLIKKNEQLYVLDDSQMQAWCKGGILGEECEYVSTPSHSKAPNHSKAPSHSKAPPQGCPEYKGPWKSCMGMRHPSRPCMKDNSCGFDNRSAEEKKENPYDIR